MYDQVAACCSICGEKLQSRQCASCLSLERQRALATSIKEGTVTPPEGRLLMVSAAGAEITMAINWDVTIETLDVRPEAKQELIADICAMPEIASQSYDGVFASCVLRHVYDSESAISELARVTRSGGRLFVSEFIEGDVTQDLIPPHTDWYGKETYEKYRVATFRIYGSDLKQKLQRHYRDVQYHSLPDPFTDERSHWYVCTR